jgi:predicted CoA-substrate-specific enzyme activase
MKHNDNTKTIGLDIGALAVKAYVMDGGKAEAFYRLHKGHPEEAIRIILGEVIEAPFSMAMTGSGGRRIAEAIGSVYVDPAVALIAAASGNEGVRHIIDIGGGSLSIVDLDAEGRFAGFRTNSLCAAGTGSFLDEQAARMGIDEDARCRGHDIESPPRIAARCAVFAKSDLIHRQQEGFTVPEMWSGLCKGMAGTAASTLFRGRRPCGPVMFVGGVALNREVVKWLTEEISAGLIIPDDPATFSARGTTRAARQITRSIDLSSAFTSGEDRPEQSRPALRLNLSSYPSFECGRSYIDDETEVRIHREIRGDVICGLDIGSTSTKAAMLGEDGTVLADLYRRTSGNPILATQKIFACLARAAGENEFKVIGVGTTGSGRKMIGAIVGADRVINEITAHVHGAKFTDPDVQTIFEIGGQDSKFVALREGVPHDSNMNYVCAAGTGSFVEEQAQKLGFKLRDIGPAVIGKSPPYSTDRCTVFMEQDVNALIRKGFSRDEAMGSVLYSVVQNYLNRVVGKRPYSKGKICFMGATARNVGVVAAFENTLKVPISVSPYCHVMGALGVARIVNKEVVARGAKTTFVGMDAIKADVVLRRESCELCTNRCNITRALVGGSADESSAPSWGYLCGRDPDDKSVRMNPCFELFKVRHKLLHTMGTNAALGKDAPAIGIPLALLNFSHLPMWRRFFGELGVRVVLSRPTHEGTLAIAEDFIGSDYCYPVKLAHGHVRELVQDKNLDHIFLPYMTQAEGHDDGFKRSVFCPYNISFPSLAKMSGLADAEGKDIISCVINFQQGDDINVKNLHDALHGAFGVTPSDVKKAWTKAKDEQRRFGEALVREGSEYLKRMRDIGGKGLVILGRPYNTCDFGSNLNLPRKIADMGLFVFPVDMLPLKDTRIEKRYDNMYWRFGRKILQAATMVASTPDLFAVYLTNFGCGPDSFLQTYVERVLRGKPMLMLELDEHSADAGYMTRLEAFRDVIKNTEVRKGNGYRYRAACELRRIQEPYKRGARGAGERAASERASRSETPVSIDIDRLWVPPMHPYGTPLLSAALRSVGYPARPLPSETLETFEAAKAHCRGTECVPAPSTIGAFLGVLKNSKDPSRECFFMPTAKGPCRFGQYNTLHRIILDEAGYKDTPIESWDDGSGDFGLSMKASQRAYSAIVCGDLLYKARCRLRPYAKDRAAFDSTMEDVMRLAVRAIESGGDTKRMLNEVAGNLGTVEIVDVKKPLVGIVGEIYVRLNTYTNGNLVETIEDAGGEAWVAPTSEWFQYLTYLDKILARERGEGVLKRIPKVIKHLYMRHKETGFAASLSPIIGDRREPPIASTVAAGERVFPRQFDGESILTVGRAIEFAHQGADLIVNCAPFGCMPGTLTSGIFQKLEGELGVPIVSLFFDGETDLRHLVRTYLANLIAMGRFGRRT